MALTKKSREAKKKRSEAAKKAAETRKRKAAAAEREEKLARVDKTIAAVTRREKARRGQKPHVAEQGQARRPEPHPANPIRMHGVPAKVRERIEAAG